MLRGALLFTGNSNDTVYICRNKIRTVLTRNRDLKMSSFVWYGNTSDTCTGNPSAYQQAYSYMSGFKRCGTPWIHPNGYQTKYVYSGDPVTGQGWLQASQDDQRFIMSTGPVNMAPGDTQVVVVAQVIARSSSNLNSITALRQLTTVVTNYYNTCYTSPPIGIIPQTNEIPGEFMLFQNYPNPFNPVTKIKFQIPKSAFVTLKIYDLLGKELEALVREQLNPGKYDVNFDGTDYASGIYYYELSAEGFAESKKMILIK